MTEEQVRALTEALKQRLGASVEAEAINDRGRYRLAVTSERFTPLTHLQRQDLVWKVVDEVLPRDATLGISLILAFAPNELAATD